MMGCPGTGAVLLLYCSELQGRLFGIGGMLEGAELPLSAGRRCSKPSCLALHVLESAVGIPEST